MPTEKAKNLTFRRVALFVLLSAEKKNKFSHIFLQKYFLLVLLVFASEIKNGE